MQVIYALIFLGAMGGLYALLYTLNHRTPVPEGCENLKAECDGCHLTSCENNPVHDMSKGEEKDD